MSIESFSCKREQKSIKRKILYVGPMGFREGVWDTRAAYIFPDIFSELYQDSEIYMLTAKVPDFALSALNDLCEKYGIRHVTVRSNNAGLSQYQYWANELEFISKKIEPDVITNIFGCVSLGDVMGIVGKKLSARVVLRFAGDEIASRVPIGTYKRDVNLLTVDIARQLLGVQLADSIIVMSPVEKERICQFLPRNEWKKVHVCIRGIDVKKFSFRQPVESFSVDKFLYVGRKSLEKGYDILEDVANLTFQEDRKVRFHFAGSFSPEEKDNRKYLGWVDSQKLHDVFCEHDAFIMTSRTEGFPQVVAEAMSTGLPCVLPKKIFKNIFVDGKHAQLTSLSPSEVKAKVMELHNDPQLANSLSIEARNFAEEKLDHKLWRKIYKDIVCGNDDSLDEIFPFDENADCDFMQKEDPLKMVFLIKTTSFSEKALYKINEIIFEMQKRGHLIYLICPDDNKFTCRFLSGVIYIQSGCDDFDKEEICKVNPDVLFYLPYDQIEASFFRNLNACFVAIDDLLEKSSISVSSETLLWKKESLYYFTDYIFSTSNDTSCFTTPFKQKFQKLDCLSDVFCNEDIDVDRVMAFNKKKYDQIEAKIVDVVDAKLIESRREDLSEKDLHFFRMQRRSFQ